MALEAFETIKQLTDNVEEYPAVHYSVHGEYDRGYLAVFFLTGAPGSGLTYLAERLIQRVDSYELVRHFDLTVYSSTEDGRVICDVDDLARDLLYLSRLEHMYVCAIITGYVDNMLEVITLVDRVCPANHVQAILVKAQARMFKFNCGLRCKALQGMHPSSVDYCQLASMTEEKLEAYVANRLELLKDMFIAVGNIKITVSYNNRVPNTHSGLGWHKFRKWTKAVDWKDVFNAISLILKLKP